MKSFLLTTLFLLGSVSAYAQKATPVNETPAVSGSAAPAASIAPKTVETTDKTKKAAPQNGKTTQTSNQVAEKAKKTPQRSTLAKWRNEVENAKTQSPSSFPKLMADEASNPPKTTESKTTEKLEKSEKPVLQNKPNLVKNQVKTEKVEKTATEKKLEKSNTKKADKTTSQPAKKDNPATPATPATTVSKKVADKNSSKAPEVKQDVRQRALAKVAAATQTTEKSSAKTATTTQSETTTTATTKDEESGGVLIQVGAFRTGTLADTQMAKVSLLGLPAKVVQLKDAEGNLISVVRSRERWNQADAEKMMGRLEQHNVPTFLISF